MEHLWQWFVVAGTPGLAAIIIAIINSRNKASKGLVVEQHKLQELRMQHMDDRLKTCEADRAQLHLEVEKERDSNQFIAGIMNVLKDDNLKLMRQNYELMAKQIGVRNGPKTK